MKQLTWLKQKLSRQWILVCIVVSVAAVGVVIVVASHAAGPSVASTATNGSLSSGASVKSDPKATGGQYVGFGNPGSSYYWMINDGELAGMVKAGLSNTLLQYFFNNSHTLLIAGGNPTIDKELPDAADVKKYASEADLASDVAANKIPGTIQYLAYDNETWSYTPTNEQKCPFDYAQKAEAITHGAKLKFIFTPAVDLGPPLLNSSGCITNVAQSTQYSLPNATAKYQDYLNENVAGLGAADSDMFEIQAQQLQADYPDFDTFTAASIAQAKQANPNAPVLIGLTTDDADQTFMLSDLTNGYDKTKTTAQGYWLNIPGTGTPDPSLAISFLQQIYNELTQ